MISYFKKLLPILIAIIVISGSFFAGFYFGGEKERGNMPPEPLPAGINDGKPDTVNFAIFWNVWNTINEKYVSINGPDDQEKIWGAISGLVGSLDDPYTVFFPPKESEYFESEIQGNFSGVGMEVGMRDKMLTVIAPLNGTPAERSGILAGDKIIKIDDVATIGLSIDESVDLIRGERGTSVVLTIIREEDSEPLEIEVIRDRIEIPTIDTEKRDDGIFVIKLYSFSANSPYLFKDALREFVESNYDKLILDLRNNPGGFMEAAIDMTSWFLPAGKVVVKEVTRDGDEKNYRSKGYNIFNDNLKFAVLINRGSASASEIMAGALSEYGKVILVGEKSFGKGSVQELIPITDNTSLKITISRWFTPNGVSISDSGLVPDVEVLFTKEDFIAGEDPQIEKAVEILMNK